MKIAVIGLGNIGKVHAAIAQKQETLVAVCDVDKDVLEKYNALKYTDYIAMLEEVKPDVVHICTPHYLHAEMVVECLKRNIHVLCEKPMGISKKEISSVLEAEKNSSAQLGICFQNRYNPENTFVKEYLEKDPPIGGVGHVTWKRDAAYYAQAEWRGKWKTEGGGVLINQAIHTIDLMQWLLGEPTSINATTANLTLQNAIEVEDTACLLCKGPAPFTFYATTGGAFDLSVEMTIYTKEHSLHIQQNKVSIDGEPVELEANAGYNGKPCYGNGHERLIADFYDCVKNNKKFLLDGKEGAKALKIVLEAYEQNRC